MKNAIFFGLIILFASCATIDNTTETSYWVNSYKVDCEGVAPMSCLQVQKTESLEEGEWQNFYSEIEGFSYEPGYIYKLKVKEEKLKNVPADASSIKYSLVKVLEKEQDARFAINDIWVLKTIDGIPITATENTPQLEIRVAAMKMMGNDGCNNFMGSVTRLTDNEIEFGPVAGTRRMCSDMTVPDTYNLSLSIVKTYKIANMKLTFFDEAGKELLVFKKVD